MKRLFLVLLFLGVAATCAQIPYANSSVPYYNAFEHELSVMRERPWNLSPFFVAVSKGDMQTVRNKVNSLSPEQKKLLMEAKDKHGMTGLMVAVEHGQPDMVTLFIKNGSDLTETTDDSVHPLEAAARHLKGLKDYIADPRNGGMNNPRVLESIKNEAWKMAPTDGGVIKGVQ